MGWDLLRHGIDDLGDRHVVGFGEGLDLVDRREEVRNELGQHRRDRGDRGDIGEVDDESGDDDPSWFRYFPLSAPSSRMSGVRKQNVSLPQSILGDLNELSQELGVSSSPLASMCIAGTLSSQPSILPEHATRMEESVLTFFELCKIRCEVAEFLIVALRKRAT